MPAQAGLAVSAGFHPGTGRADQVGIVRELATIGLGGIAGGHGIEAGIRFTVCRKNGIPITAYIYMHVGISAEELKTIRHAGLLQRAWSIFSFTILVSRIIPEIVSNSESCIRLSGDPWYGRHIESRHSSMPAVLQTKTIAVRTCRFVFLNSPCFVVTQYVFSANVRWKFLVSFSQLQCV